MTRPANKRKPVLLALAASFLLTVLIIVGSRNLEHYDSALFGYTVASVVTFGAIVFRYAIWLQRPATRVYWRHVYKRFPLKYDPQYWGMVFPFGMYTVCTFQLSNAIGFPTLLVIPRFFVYLALAGWIAVSVGLLGSLLRSRAPVTHLPFHNP